MDECKYFGKTEGTYQIGMLKACSTCERSIECYETRQDEFPYYGRTFAIGFSVEKEYEGDLDALVKDVKTYIKTKMKKIKTCESFDPGLSESGYYKER